LTLTVQVLRSGSSGNALLARTDRAAVLVDAGLTREELAAELEARGLSIASLDGVVLTHAHGDHVGCARSLARRDKRRLFLSAPAAAAQPLLRRIKTLTTFEPGVPVEIGDLTIETVALAHDSPGTVACVLSHGGARFGVATDLGRPSDALEAALARCRAFLLEFNHDERLIREGLYPWRLKRRVLGEEGHLSNDQAASILARSLSPLTRHVFLGHLSDKNNRPELALAAAAAVLGRLGRADVRLEVAPRGAASSLVTITPEMGTVPEEPRGTGP
jgi:phosphoribosyl 1,2-cyclic phosphodiesterase